MNVTVLVSKCVYLGDKNFGETGGYRIYGKRLVEVSYSTLAEARAEGDKLRATGMSVVVRPSYNETDADGTFFREWRSFNGERFQECRFGIG